MYAVCLRHGSCGGFGLSLEANARAARYVPLKLWSYAQGSMMHSSNWTWHWSDFVDANRASRTSMLGTTVMHQRYNVLQLKMAATWYTSTAVQPATSKSTVFLMCLTVTSLSMFNQYVCWPHKLTYHMELLPYSFACSPPPTGCPPFLTLRVLQIRLLCMLVVHVCCACLLCKLPENINKVFVPVKLSEQPICCVCICLVTYHVLSTPVELLHGHVTIQLCLITNWLSLYNTKHLASMLTVLACLLDLRLMSRAEGNMCCADTGSHQADQLQQAVDSFRAQNSSLLSGLVSQANSHVSVQQVCLLLF